MRRRSPLCLVLSARRGWRVVDVASLTLSSDRSTNDERPRAQAEAFANTDRVAVDPATLPHRDLLAGETR